MSLYQKICNSRRPYLVAEAGVNHNGDFNLALKLIDAAKENGADAVKFQTFITENILTKGAPTADYQKKEGIESQFEMAKALELPFDDFLKLKKYSEKNGITFLSTPDDEDSLEYLCSIGIELIKIGSGEVTNHPFLCQIAKTRKPVVLSTGMSSMEEVKEAVTILQEAGTQELILLQCTSQYPAPPQEINLRVMETLRKEFNVPVGFSDHTQGIHISLAAAALGAVLIEKHMTLSRTMRGPDHSSSLEPNELKKLASELNDVSLALGSGIKKLVPSEASNRVAAHRSVVARKAMKIGEEITQDKISFKRAGIGIEAKDYKKVLGTKLLQSVSEDDLLAWNMLTEK